MSSHCRRRLFTRHNDIHIVAASQAVIADRKQAVCIGRQIDADNIRLLVHDVIDEAGVLMAESVVVLTPDVRGKQIIQRRDRTPPGDVSRNFQPFGMLIEHRIHDVDERFVAGEKAMAPGKQITFEPTLAHVLAEHFDDAAVGR